MVESRFCARLFFPVKVLKTSDKSILHGITGFVVSITFGTVCIPKSGIKGKMVCNVFADVCSRKLHRTGNATVKSWFDQLKDFLRF